MNGLFAAIPQSEERRTAHASRAMTAREAFFIYKRIPVFLELGGVTFMPGRSSARSGIRHPVNCTGPIIGNEQRTIRHYQDIGRTAPRGRTLQPSFGERFVLHCLISLQAHKREAIADGNTAIP